MGKIKTKKAEKKVEEKKVDALAIVQKQTKGMQEMLDNSPVTNDKELSGVSDKIKQVKSLKKFITAEKEKFTEPAKAIIAEAKIKYDPYIKECDNAEIVLKSRAMEYMDEVEKKRKEAEAKIVADLESGKIKKVETAVKKMENLAEAPKTISTVNSSLQMKKRKVAKIVKMELIPDKYWVVDEVRVRREALDLEKMGMPQIPGVEIVEESSLSSI